MWTLKKIPNVNCLFGFCIKWWLTLYDSNESCISWLLVLPDYVNFVWPWCTWHGPLEDILIMTPRTFYTSWRTLCPWCRALHLLMIGHALGHLSIPLGPWIMDRWGQILQIWLNWISNGKETHTMNNAPLSHIGLWFKDIAPGDDGPFFHVGCLPFSPCTLSILMNDVMGYDGLMMAWLTIPLRHPFWWWVGVLWWWDVTFDEEVFLSPMLIGCSR